MFKNLLQIDKVKLFFRKSYFFSKVYNRLYALKAKKTINKTIRELNHFNSYPIEKASQIQNIKLLKFLNYAYNKTDYYNNLFDEKLINPKKITDFKRIPFLDKQKIRTHLNSLISRDFEIKNLGKKKTGGSTGQPLEFYCNTEAGVIDFGHHWHLYKLMGHKKDDIIVGCGGLVIHEDLRKNDIYWVTKNKGNVFGDYMFSVLYLTNENISLYVAKIIKIKPQILRGYPSFYDSVAQYILKNNIELDFDVKGVNLTAEMCSEQQKNNIEKAFSTMVYFEYGHSEVCLYCYTKDDSYIYQSSPAYGYIEVLNEDGTDTPVGKVGDIVVTGFLNSGMPFIRYKTGDLGELYQRKGGIVKFKKIFGRSQDFIISKKGEKVYLTALIFGQHLNAFSNIEKWQITQNIVGEISISIIKSESYSNEDETDIINKITGVTDVEIEFIYTRNIPQTKSGKHLFLIQNLKN